MLRKSQQSVLFSAPPTFVQWRQIVAASCVYVAVLLWCSCKKRRLFQARNSACCSKENFKCVMLTTVNIRACIRCSSLSKNRRWRRLNKLNKLVRSRGLRTVDVQKCVSLPVPRFASKRKPYLFDCRLTKTQLTMWRTFSRTRLSHLAHSTPP